MINTGLYQLNETNEEEWIQDWEEESPNEEDHNKTFKWVVDPKTKQTTKTPTRNFSSKIANFNLKSQNACSRLEECLQCEFICTQITSGSANFRKHLGATVQRCSDAGTGRSVGVIWWRLVVMLPELTTKTNVTMHERELVTAKQDRTKKTSNKISRAKGVYMYMYTH